jgi:threonine 3-dehydrogenase
MSSLETINAALALERARNAALEAQLAAESARARELQAHYEASEAQLLQAQLREEELVARLAAADREVARLRDQRLQLGAPQRLDLAALPGAANSPPLDDAAARAPGGGGGSGLGAFQEAEELRLALAASSREAILVRAAAPADFPGVQALVFSSHARALAAPGRDITPRLPLIFPTLAKANLFTAPSSHYWVAVSPNGAIVGAISIIMVEGAPPPAAAELNAFYVAEDHQRRGVGARLMGAALAFCRAAAVGVVSLTSNRGHYDPAIRYYERLGFHHVKEYEVAPGIVLVDMELALQPPPQPQPQPPQQPRVLVIGGAGAIGRRLIEALVARGGPGSVVAALRTTTLPAALAPRVVCEFGVDVRSEASLRALFAKHAASTSWVWNLAAPLSVETAADPAVAHDVTVGGMERLLRCMKEAGLSRICFSDSIGSFGAAAPRENAAAAWLTAHPLQDPGSDYGRQKRGCRELLQRYAAQHGFDTRWAVIPGVLHTDAAWGAGTTEYALDAMLCAARGAPFASPVPRGAVLPMIFADDLVEGLLRLMDADRARLREPEGGYALAGFSFSAGQLFALLAARFPTFEAGEALTPAAAFAELWPNSISAEEARRDLGFVARSGFLDTVEAILRAHGAAAGGSGGAAAGGGAPPAASAVA